MVCHHIYIESVARIYVTVSVECVCLVGVGAEECHGSSGGRSRKHVDRGRHCVLH